MVSQAAYEGKIRLGCQKICITRCLPSVRQVSFPPRGWQCWGFSSNHLNDLKLWVLVFLSILNITTPSRFCAPTGPSRVRWEMLFPSLIMFYTTQYLIWRTSAGASARNDPMKEEFRALVCSFSGLTPQSWSTLSGDYRPLRFKLQILVEQHHASWWRSSR